MVLNSGVPRSLDLTSVAIPNRAAVMLPVGAQRDTLQVSVNMPFLNWLNVVRVE
jgi:hypothetical protein